MNENICWPIIQWWRRINLITYPSVLDLFYYILLLLAPFHQNLLWERQLNFNLSGINPRLITINSWVQLAFWSQVSIIYIYHYDLIILYYTSYLRSNWRCVQYFKIFKMADILSSRQTVFTRSHPGSWIYQKDSHEHYRHFEHLIDAVAEILTEVYQFQNLTYFVTWWRHQWRHEYAKHNLHNQTSPTMYLKNIVCVAPVLHG